MTEQDMVLDVLSSVKSSIGGYAKNITECANPQLRQQFQQLRDGDEKFQYDLFKIAEAKGYYEAAPQVPQKDLNTIKSFLTEQAAQSFA